MIKSIYTLAIFSSIIIASCNTVSKNTNNDEKNISQTNVKSTNKEIPFIEAKNYFVKNTYKVGQLNNPKITSQKDFEEIFGMAAIMGKKGKPTEIDFSKQYVIAVIAEVTDKSTILKATNLQQKDNNIILTYEFKEGEKQTYSIQPFILLVIDNKYQGEVILEKLL